MDAVQKEHDRLMKKLKASQGIQNVQSTIDMLQAARDTIASGAYWVLLAIYLLLLAWVDNADVW